MPEYITTTYGPDYQSSRPLAWREYTWELVEKQSGGQMRTVMEPVEKVEIPLTDEELTKVLLLGQPIERNGVWSLVRMRYL